MVICSARWLVPQLSQVYLCNISKQKSGARHEDDHHPGESDQNGRGVEISGVGHIDGQQRRHAEHHCQAFADRYRLGDLIGKGVIFFAPEAEELENHRQGLAAEHEIDEKNMDEKEQHQQRLDQSFGQGQHQGDIVRYRLCIHGCFLIHGLGIVPLI